MENPTSQDHHGLPTPRTTLRAGLREVLVWCKDRQGGRPAGTWLFAQSQPCPRRRVAGPAGLRPRPVAQTASRAAFPSSEKSIAGAVRQSTIIEDDARLTPIGEWWSWQSTSGCARATERRPPSNPGSGGDVPILRQGKGSNCTSITCSAGWGRRGKNAALLHSARAGHQRHAWMPSGLVSPYHERWLPETP